MPNIAGVDGCPAGWIALIENTETRRITAHVFLTFRDLVIARDAAVIAIDIPIGLTESGPRDCDRLARQNLGAIRGSSVFPAPVRAALNAPTYVSAKTASIAAQKKGISKQAFVIYPKIREVDDALRSDADLRSTVFEVHPELTFSTWGYGPIVAPKRTREGHATRRALIDAHFGADAFNVARNEIDRKLAANDDIVDAFAALWTAQRIIRRECRSLPEDPPLDRHGLPMRMVH